LRGKGGKKRMGWYWLEGDKITPIPSLCDAGTDEDTLKAISGLAISSKAKVVWVEEAEEALRRFDEENRLRRRLEGHKEAVKRWREKAGVEAPPKEVTYYTSEFFVRERQKRIEHHWILPVERNPAIFEEAKIFAKNYCRERGMDLKRVYFNHFQGWVMVTEAPDPDLEYYHAF